MMERLWENRFTRPVKQRAVAALARNDFTRRTLLNPYCERLSWSGASKFHGRYAKIFRRPGSTISPGAWTLTFCGKAIKMPLDRRSAWLDWDSAVSVLGHDAEIKALYEQLLTSSARPETFFDIGANYGTHSLQFLACGVPTVSFEPNPDCRTVFETICSANDLSPHWEPVALSDSRGEAALVFEPTETWLGRVSKRQHPGAKTVSTRCLDDYLPLVRGRLLIKMDVEGHEAEVLRGGDEMLRTVRPLLIFESNSADERQTLFDQFSHYGYAIHALTLRGRSARLSLEKFQRDGTTNFLATPDTDSR